MGKFATPTFAKTANSREDHHATSASIEVSNSKRELNRRLDQALEETFPASDPVSIVISA